MISPLLFHCSKNAWFPNNRVPVILYKEALKLPFLFKAHFIKKVFAQNGWSNTWNSGVFTYHHYHSTSHEVLGFFRGSTTLQLGGETGHQVEVRKGDVLIIPAGVAHKNLGKEHQVSCIGAYADGRDYDINTGKTGERPGTDHTIASLPFPKLDPLYGKSGLIKIWARALNPMV